MLLSAKNNGATVKGNKTFQHTNFIHSTNAGAHGSEEMSLLNAAEDYIQFRASTRGVLEWFIRNRLLQNLLHVFLYINTIYK